MGRPTERRGECGERAELSLKEGLVTGVLGKRYSAEVEGEEWRLSGRGKLFRRGAGAVVGDRVRLEPSGGKTGRVIEILPRYSALSRRMPGHEKLVEQVVAANIDQVLVCVALREPDMLEGLVDRYLVTSEFTELTAVVVVNKIDLGDEDEAREKVSVYVGAGYGCLFTSARSGHGLERLKETLAGRKTVFVGPSGVGKSTLLNAIQPGLKLRTGEISGATGKGKHTTTSSLLIRAAGGWLVDTPGIREFALWGMEASCLDQLFPEMRPLLGDCRFSDCTHLPEPGCLVKKAVEEGGVSRRRYETYSRLMKEVRARERGLYGG